MYKSLLDGTHNQLSFPFMINDQQIDHLYCLVDGINPAMSRFLLTLLIAVFLPNKKVGGKQLREPLVFGRRSFFLLTTQPWLYKCEDIFLFITATIVPHNKKKWKVLIATIMSTHNVS